VKTYPYLCGMKYPTKGSIVNLKQEIMTTEIKAQDVAQVAIDLGMDITIGQVNQVLEMYDDEADNDPTATWNLIVENCLYNLQS
jgi:hypothetical protein